MDVFVEKMHAWAYRAALHTNPDIVFAIYRESTLGFMNALPPVVDKVMSCFAIGLGFPEDFFKEVCFHTSFSSNPKYSASCKVVSCSIACCVLHHACK